MTSPKSHSYMYCILSLLLLVVPSESALPTGSGVSHDTPSNPYHIDQLPPEVRSSVFRMCEVRPNAAHYFATYLDNARIIRLHFEHFNCEGRSVYRNAGLCLHEEFVSTGTKYRLSRHYYGRCDD